MLHCPLSEPALAGKECWLQADECSVRSQVLRGFAQSPSAGFVIQMVQKPHTEYPMKLSIEENGQVPAIRDKKRSPRGRTAFCKTNVGLGSIDSHIYKIIGRWQK